MKSIIHSLKNFFAFLIILLMSLSSCIEEDTNEQLCSLQNETYSFEIDENAENETVLGNAILPDQQNIRYSIISGNDDRIFKLDNESGALAIFNADNLDYEKSDTHTLQIRASTDNCNDATIIVNINVKNIQEPYVDIAYSDIKIEKDLTYGEDPDQNMWLYTPTEATAAPRPALVFAGGGAFNPSNLDVLESLAIRFAKSGYVVATIRYHVDPDAAGTFERFRRSVIASHDLKAAIRFFRKDADTENLYNVDPNNIFLGGHGTGAFLTYFTTYGKMDDIPSSLVSVVDDLGGMDGMRGNEGYESTTNATFALSGAVVGDLTLIDAGEDPAFMIHSTEDTDVPCEEDSGNFGSCLIAERMKEVGIAHELVLMEGNHRVTQYCQPCFDQALSFLARYLK